MHRRRSLVLLVALEACSSKSKPVARDAAPAPVPLDAPVPDAAPHPLAGYPQVDAVHTLRIPTTKPRGDEVGPVLAGDLAIVGGSGFGFAAIDYARGVVAWTKPAGPHLAPPLVHDANILLVADCDRPLPVPDGERLLGCLRVVTPTGADQAYLPIHGKNLDAFADATGPQRLYPDLRWVKGDHAVTLDALSGRAKLARTTSPPPLAVTYRGTRFDITHEDGKVVARGKKPWRTERRYTAVTGIVWADRSPLVRVVNLLSNAGLPEAFVIDMDATGSLHAAVARSTPAHELLGFATNHDTALALRGDIDFIVGYASNAALIYVHDLPAAPRTRVGVAVTRDAVVAFFDGDRVVILPPIAAPPTAPGASPAP